MKTQKPYLDEQTGERFAEPPSPLPLYLVYLPESNEDDLLSSVQAANFIERELRDGFVAGRVSRDAEVAELREAYENWKSSGQAMHAALLEIWHSVTAWDTSDMTFGDDPQSVVKAVRESVSAEVAELKAKIAAAVARLNAASIPPMMTEAQFNATTITDARRILLGSASSPVEGHDSTCDGLDGCQNPAAHSVEGGN